MKKLIWFSTLSLAIAATTLPAVAQTPANPPGQPISPTETTPSTQPIPPAETTPSTQPISPTETTPTTQPIQSGQPIPYERTAPRISSTSGYPDTHYISIYTGEQPLSYVVVRPPQMVSVNDNSIEVTDQSGRKIDANITKEGDRIRINFAQPVAPATNLQIALKNLGFEIPNRNFYLYELAGGYTGYLREIPYGFAQVQIF